MIEWGIEVRPVARPTVEGANIPKRIFYRCCELGVELGQTDKKICIENIFLKLFASSKISVFFQHFTAGQDELVHPQTWSVALLI